MQTAGCRPNWQRDVLRGDKNVSNTLDDKETATFEEVLISNICTQDAIINVPVRKGLLMNEEILLEINSFKPIRPKVNNSYE